ncbi:hypothetical protein MBCUT_10240 [Methanobrevibacter cuticularis]|uniref:Uncharacterized protein n=1 Tax=Methanobrevibacter cuticularis TaxID=47311 RepID=A0A166E0Y7_9EURY|nr:hypothetical protein [Methanobrevibacter cuticularis]KZX16158.1 hypothetical protein MBCUT_10240 [Methanobrevibacter cuticularis]
MTSIKIKNKMYLKYDGILSLLGAAKIRIMKDLDIKKICSVDSDFDKVKSISDFDKVKSIECIY